MLPFTGTTAMFVGTDADDYELNLLATSFEHLRTTPSRDLIYDDYTATDGIDPIGWGVGPLPVRRRGWPEYHEPRGLPIRPDQDLYDYKRLWPSSRNDLEDAQDESDFWAPSLSGPVPADARIASLWKQQQQPSSTSPDRARSLASAWSWPAPPGDIAPPDASQPRNDHGHQHHHSFACASPMPCMLAMHSEAHQAPGGKVHSDDLAVFRGSAQPFRQSFHLPQPTTTPSPAVWLNQQQSHNNGMDGHQQSLNAAVPRHMLGPKDGNALLTAPDQGSAHDSASSTAPAKTFKPMQMVFRERDRRASASSTGTSSSGSGTSGTSGTSGSSPAPFYSYYTAAAATTACLPPPSLQPPGTPPLSHDEQYFRRQQGISLNYRGDIHNPHNRGDHVPAHANTSLFLMGLPPSASVGDLLRAVAQLGPTGRVFAASVNPPDPTRRLPLAAAKISYFERAQAETLKALVDAQQLVMHSGANQYIVRCSWNRDKKAPRRCVQASECRVLRIRGPRSVVNFASLTAYFGEKFRYELQDVGVVSTHEGEGIAGSDDEQTMEWRFASFQSQAIAAKMALNQERKMVRVEYGRDPCEWGE